MANKEGRIKILGPQFVRQWTLPADPPRRWPQQVSQPVQHHIPVTVQFPDEAENPNVHILCPFYRRHLYHTLIHYYSKMGIIFHPICDSIDIEPFKDNKIEWVKPFLCPPLKPREQCYTKFNYFINAGNIVDEDFYGFVGDDDMYEQGIIDELKKQRTGVVYVSNYRGDHIPDDGSVPHPVAPIIPRSRDDIKPCHIGLGQFFVRGHILKKVRFENSDGADDGRFAQKIYPLGSVVFMNTWFTFGNFFQPGRHTDPAKFLKPTWKLPQVVYEGLLAKELESIEGIPDWDFIWTSLAKKYPYMKADQIYTTVKGILAVIKKAR